jgi:hypothetical protein
LEGSVLCLLQSSLLFNWNHHTIIFNCAIKNYFDQRRLGYCGRKFGNFCRNSAKQATGLYVHSPLLKTPLRKKMKFLCSEVKTIFPLKFDS